MELFHIDIETAGKYPDFKTFKENDEIGAKLFEKKFSKMKWSDMYESIDDAYIVNAGIISTYGKIVCISFGFNENNGNKRISSFYGENEKEIVESFNNLMKKVEVKDFNLAGFKIKHFDMPWILHKLHHHSIKPANILYLYNKKPWEVKLIDMSEDWKQKFYLGYSFDEMCYELGVESSKLIIDGSDVHSKYWNGELEQIKEYCERDIISSIDCALKLYS